MCSRVGLYNFMGEAMCKSELKKKKEEKTGGEFVPMQCIIWRLEMI